MIQKIKDLISIISKKIKKIIKDHAQKKNLKKLGKENNTVETIDNFNYEKVKSNYISKPFMTNCEKEFYSKMSSLENEYKIVPQINLATIIDKKGYSKYHNELFRNIDFAIFTKDYSRLLLLVELNDATHYMKERKRRDKKVSSICYEAGINIIRFYTTYKNEQEYVIKRITDEINKVNEKILQKTN